MKKLFCKVLEEPQNMSCVRFEGEHLSPMYLFTKLMNLLYFPVTMWASLRQI